MGHPLRAPNGAIQDILEYSRVGRPYYNPQDVTAPTLVTTGEWDCETPPAMAKDLHERLSSVQEKELNILPKATHHALLEKNRQRLFDTVQQFIER